MEKDQIGYPGTVAILIFTVLFAVTAGLETAPGQVIIPWLARVSVIVIGIIMAIVYYFLIRKSFRNNNIAKVILAIVGVLIMVFGSLYLHGLLAPSFL